MSALIRIFVLCSVAVLYVEAGMWGSDDGFSPRFRAMLKMRANQQEQARADEEAMSRFQQTKSAAVAVTTPTVVGAEDRFDYSRDQRSMRRDLARQRIGMWQRYAPLEANDPDFIGASNMFSNNPNFNPIFDPFGQFVIPQEAQSVNKDSTPLTPAEQQRAQFPFADALFDVIKRDPPVDINFGLTGLSAGGSSSGGSGSGTGSTGR